MPWCSQLQKEVHSNPSLVGGSEDITFAKGVRSDQARRSPNVCYYCHYSLLLLPNGPPLVLHEHFPFLQESLHLWAPHEALGVLAMVSGM